MSMEQQAAAPRVLSGFDIVALGLNGVIGSGIFLLPGAAAALLGPAALVAFALAGLSCLLIALCFAEAGSRYEGSGGPALYAGEAFGPFAQFLVGWISWVIRVVSWAALANGFARALVAVAPGLAGTEVWLAVVVILGLGVANVFAVRLGAYIVDGLTIVKLVPIVAFVAAGVLVADLGRLTPFAPEGWGPLGETVLLVLWAYAGFENIGVPAGEVRSPKTVVPRALLAVMGIVTVLYLVVFTVTATTHPSLPGSTAPVAEAATYVVGPIGGPIIGASIALSVLGTAAGSALIAPRFLHVVLAGRSRIRALGTLHADTNTPVAATVLSTVLAILLAASGTFEQLAVVSVVARFAQYVPTCLAVVVFRWRGDPPGALTLPGGSAIPVITTVWCLGLLALAPWERLAAGGLAVLSGVPAYFLLLRPDRR